MNDLINIKVVKNGNPIFANRISVSGGAKDLFVSHTFKIKEGGEAHFYFKGGINISFTLNVNSPLIYTISPAVGNGVKIVTEEFSVIITTEKLKVYKNGLKFDYPLNIVDGHKFKIAEKEVYFLDFESIAA